MPTILVTWWCWFIWSHTAVALLEDGYDLVIVDNLSNSEIWVLDSIDELSWKPVVYDSVDIRDEEWLSSIFSTHSIHAVIHFAWIKAVWESCEFPFRYYDNNIVGTINLLKAMDRYQVKKLIFSSSATVYDSLSQKSPYSEQSLTGYCTNPYWTTKFVIEQLLRDIWMRRGSDIIALRYFNPIWAHPSWLIWENPQWVPNNIFPYLMKVASGEYDEFTIFGDDYDTPDGTWIRDYIHVVDLANAHLAALKKVLSSKTWFTSVNIWTWTWTSVLEMIQIVQKCIGAEIPYKVWARRPWDISESVASVAKAKSYLDRESKLSVKEAAQDWRNYLQA